MSDPNFPIIKFKNAINAVPSSFTTPIYTADQTNNENNAAKKLDNSVWQDVLTEANDAFESLYIAQSKGGIGDTTLEWKHVFGPSFNISND